MVGIARGGRGHTIAMPVEASPPGADEVRVWFADARGLARDADWHARALSWLTPVERARHDRFVHEDDRLMFLTGRAMARTLVGRALDCPPTAWRWKDGPHGRPEIN